MNIWHHPQARSLLEAIHAQPEDDMVRLLFADWLEEHGQLARAEFIRVQCERAHLPSWYRRALELSWREQDLLDEHGHLWFAEAPVLPGVFWAGFERGFLSHIHVPDLACLATNAETLRSVPGLRVTVQQIRRDEVARVPILPSLRGLSCLETPETDSLTRLMEAPWTAPLTDLDLTNLPIDGDCLDSLCRTSSPMRPERLGLCVDSNRAERFEWLFNAPWLSAVTCLRIDGSSATGYCNPDQELAGLIARMPGASRLRELSVRNRPNGPPGLYSLLSAPFLSGLTRLDLDAEALNWINPEALSNLPARPHLRELRLGGSGVPAEKVPVFLGCKALANLQSLELRIHSSSPAQKNTSRTTWPPNLQFLNLSKSSLTERDFLALLKSLPWDSLSSLILDHVRPPTSAIQRIAVGAGYGRLNVLSLRGCRLRPACVQTLLRENLSLLDLDLRGNHLGPKGVHALSQSPTLAQSLRRLALSSGTVGNSGVESLSRQNWPELRDLLLPDCQLSDAAIEHLMKAPHFAQLTRLNLSRNAFGRETLKQLFFSQLACRVTHLGLNHAASQWQVMAALVARPELGRLRALGIRGFLDQTKQCDHLVRSSLPATCAVDWTVPNEGLQDVLQGRFPGLHWARQYFRLQECEQDDDEE